MKKTRLAAAIVLAMALNTAQADFPDDEEPVQDVSVEQVGNIGAGAMFGAALAGPFGAILGGITGNLLGEAGDDAEQIARLEAELAESKFALASLQQQNGQLEKQAKLSKVVLQRRQHNVDFYPKGFSMSVQFRHNSSGLEPVFRRQLAEVAKTFAGMDHLFIHLSGHADRSGPDSYNYVLSRQRVHAVANVLTAAGWPKHRLRISVHGERQPLGDVADQPGYAFDRRVGLVLSASGKEI